MAAADVSVDREQLLLILGHVIDELNEDEFAEKPLTKDPETRLFGRDGTLDSLSLVNLVLAVEERTEDVTGRSISLADDRAISQERSPFLTIGSLVDYMTLLLSE